MVLPTPPSVAPSAELTSRIHCPELLAPAGDWLCARAAVENGADAIYFGIEKFNARMRAENFTTSQLPELMAFLHERGVKGYVTLNTLVFTSELKEAEETLRLIIAAGVDAAIVQDVGLCRLIRQISPDFPIHASTQMTITSGAGVRFAQQLGCSVAVLARECSLVEISKIQQELNPGSQPNQDNTPPFPLEVFVHGALCVAYSGQCLTSEALGGRSANRGECAQACRMPYQLIADGQEVSLGDRKYLLSPQDLAGINLIPQLAQAGVSSLKIEGRLKTPEYVANVTRNYRRALNRLSDSSAIPVLDPADPAARKTQYDLEMAFSRGLHTGWLQGINNQRLVHARFGKKRGVLLGAVTRVTRQEVFALIHEPLKAGDGVVFDNGNPADPEEGGRIYFVDPFGKETRLKFGPGSLNLQRLNPGDRIWKTSDPELEQDLRLSFKPGPPKFRRPVHAQIQGQLGTPLTLTLRDESGCLVEVQSKVPLTAAQQRPLESTFLTEQLGRMGNTPLRLASLDCRIPNNLMLPVSELNQLRREACEKLLQIRTAGRRWSLNPTSPLQLEPPAAPAIAVQIPPTIIPLVRSLPQLDATLALGYKLIYCELEDPKKYRDAVQFFRQYTSQQPASPAQAQGIFIAPPRIFKPGEEWVLKIVESAQPDGFLIRNHQHLEYFRHHRGMGDFSLNIANPLSASFFKQTHKLERLTASYDLNSSQLLDLLRNAPPEWFEVTVHQHMPMFHMEHCVFCAFLSRGTDFTNCGRPCEKQKVQLKDRVGVLHSLKADAGCRNTVYNGRAQPGAESITSLIEAGLRWLRVEFVDESPSETTRILHHYSALLRGEISGATLWRELKLQHQLGVTRGPIDHS